MLKVVEVVIANAPTDPAPTTADAMSNGAIARVSLLILNMTYPFSSGLPDQQNQSTLATRVCQLSLKD